MSSVLLWQGSWQVICISSKNARLLLLTVVVLKVIMTFLFTSSSCADCSHMLMSEAWGHSSKSCYSLVGFIWFLSRSLCFCFNSMYFNSFLFSVLSVSFPHFLPVSASAFSSSQPLTPVVTSNQPSCLHQLMSLLFIVFFLCLHCHQFWNTLYQCSLGSWVSMSSACKFAIMVFFY